MAAATVLVRRWAPPRRGGVGSGPTVETSFEGSVQSPRQLQYSTDIVNIIAIMAMIASPPSGIGYRVSLGPWVTDPYETRIAPLLLYAGLASGRTEVPRPRLGPEGWGRLGKSYT